jgi:hypothetical protein
MPTCDCCLIEKADAQVRAGLLPVMPIERRSLTPEVRVVTSVDLS